MFSVSFTEVEELQPQKQVKKEKKKKKVEVPPLNKKVVDTESRVSAGEYSRLVKPMELRNDNLAICPNIGMSISCNS